MRNVPEPQRHFSMRSAKAGRQRRTIDQREIQQFRIEIGDHGAGADRLAFFRHHADRAAVLDDHLAHGGADADVRAMRGRSFRHRLRDRPHAADRVAPRALLAVHLAEAVMQQHVGRARRVGARVVADDAVEAVGGLDRRALEPAVEVMPGGRGEQVEQFALQVEAEPAQPVREPAGLDQLGDRGERMTLDDIRRRLQRERAQHVGDRFEPRRIVIEPPRHRALRISRLLRACARRRPSDSARHRAAGNSRCGARRCAGRARRGADRGSPSG